MKKLLLATQNKGKSKELKFLLGNQFEILDLEDVGIFTSADEPFDTLKDNATAKAEFYYNMTNIDCIADDSGLFVDALDGEPGVLSARYAGTEATSEENIKLLLDKMEGIMNRKAEFRAVIAFRSKNEIRFFDGKMMGRILKKRCGDGGFGYDPIFQPDGYDVSNAQLTVEVKNAISHRGKAVTELVNYLLKYRV